jgi:hypothetical protein
VVGDVDNSGLYSLGFHHGKCEKKCAFAMFYEQVGYPIESYMPDPDGDGYIDGRLNFFCGREFKGIPLGFNFTFMRESYSVDGDPADKTEESNTLFGLRLGATLMENFEGAVWFHSLSWVYKDAAGADVTTPESNLELGLLGRYWYKFDDKLTLVPHLGFRYETSGYTDAVPDKHTFGTTNIELGIGTNCTPAENILAVCDFGIKLESTTDKYEPNTGTSSENTDKCNYLPFFRAGFEGKVCKWWDFRFGAVRNWEADSYETNNGDITTKNGYSTTTTYIGSAFHFKNLHLDIQMDPQFILNGPNFVSGSTTQLATMASLYYEWK